MGKRFEVRAYINLDPILMIQNMYKTQDAAERVQALKRATQEAQGTIQANRQQASVARQRREKAQRAIAICNARVKSYFQNPTAN